jgi:hypothetical protein
MGDTGATADSTIVKFVRRGPGRAGLTIVDRIAARKWAEDARDHGIRAIRIHDPESGDDPGLGSFLLIYSNDAMWARWGVAACGDGFEIWRPADGATVGWYASLAEALAEVRRQAA